MATRFAQLPHHLYDYLLDYISKSFDLDDLIRFSLVCKKWESFAKPLLPPKLLPWLIMPYNGYSCETTVFNQTLGFFSFHNRKTYKVETPQIADRRICGSCKGGWLITLHKNGEIQVFHPFSKKLINLPPVTELPGVVGPVFTKDNSVLYRVLAKGKMENILAGKMCEFYIYKAVMFSDCPSNGVVIVIYGFERKLACCRPGKDKNWIPLKGNNNCNFEDVILHQGNFYAVQDKGHVYVLGGIGSSSPFVKLVLSEPDRIMYYKKHLVDCKGELFLLRRIRYPMEPGDEEAHLTMAFTIKKIDLTGRKWVDVQDLDKDSAVFIGTNDFFSLSASNVPGCKGNSIYFTDDCLDQFVSDGYLDCLEDDIYGGHDIGIYYNADDDFDRFYPSEPKLLIKPPPVWFTTNSY
ncbi:F-box skip23-like protein [Thalictrum thalictroides]|uniref:F-box skip23-like protein n=1 Tax=Thalictrum thalictroides TaxID=46969 RepID=A0A7J6W131_THATH|nr:F-box skip23-like protein [Thalictrum thalictroides]